MNEASLKETLVLYESILQEMRDFKAGEYKQGIADGMEMVLEAVKALLTDD
ncbi:MAG: hypothetical protein SCK28_14165 [Bacillota bacterium]|nr:hypothetical protein [Bacillota bacterium]